MCACSFCPTISEQNNSKRDLLLTQLKTALYKFIISVSFYFAQKGTVLDHLNEGKVIVGDGGMTFCLEKRGYVRAGPWTPECTVENPEAG